MSNFELVTQAKAERLENNRGYAFVAPTDVCGRTDVHSGAGSSDLSGVQW